MKYQTYRNVRINLPIAAKSIVSLHILQNIEIQIPGRIAPNPAENKSNTKFLYNNKGKNYI